MRGDGPWMRLAVAVVAGIVAGWAAPWPWLYLPIGSGLLVLGGRRLARRRPAQTVAAPLVLAAVCIAASWTAIRTAYTSSTDIRQYINEGSQLVQVVGEVAQPPRLSDPGRGAMGQFAYQQPVTLVDLSLRSIVLNGRDAPASGTVRLRLEQADPRLEQGMVVRATGWLSGVDGPGNPGELDFRPIMHRLGVAGWLTVRTREGWQLEPAREAGTPLAVLQWSRRWFAQRCAAALRIGMEGDPAALALCETMLLGVREREQAEQVEAFRRVGLAHLLSISGAHLGMLLGLVWLTARLLIDRPPRVAMVVLAVLGLYMLAVPWRVPIVRAAVMAGLFALCSAAARKIRATEVLALAAVLCLSWRPMDLFDPGFQLSFGVVLALLLFAEPVSQWMWPTPELQVRGYTFDELLARRVVDYLAVSIVAFAVALPLVALHFEMINPLAIVVGCLALPVVVLMLGLGYLKILLGLFLPSAGLVLAPPLGWATTAMIALTERAAALPAAHLQLPRPPSLLWTAAALLLLVALFAGRFAGRRAVLSICGVILVGWAFVDVGRSDRTWALRSAGETPAARLMMLSVGDGSCFVLQLADGWTMMFDCGSQAYLDVGEKSIVPALQAMGVEQIDLLVLSHADIDHYAGVLDVADVVPVKLAIAPPHLLAEAELHRREAPDAPGPTAFVIDGLLQRSVEVEPVTRGWSLNLEGAELQALWPEADFSIERANDTSVVLSVRVAGRRILLTGDIQQEATTRLLATDEDLRCDVMDLAHHGSFVEASPAWLAATRPRIVLQSSGPARLWRDPWPAVLDSLAVQRFVTARDGAVEVRVSSGGQLQHRVFAGGDASLRVQPER